MIETAVSVIFWFAVAWVCVRFWIAVYSILRHAADLRRWRDKREKEGVTELDIGDDDE